jgi:hypothetical protein
MHMSTTTRLVKSNEYVGCYHDCGVLGNNHETLGHPGLTQAMSDSFNGGQLQYTFSITLTGMTIDWCWNLCQTFNFTYTGLNYGFVLYK